jgi:hypothetical protein
LKQSFGRPQSPKAALRLDCQRPLCGRAIICVATLTPEYRQARETVRDETRRGEKYVQPLNNFDSFLLDEEKQVVKLDLVEKEENRFIVLQTKNVAEKGRQEGEDNVVSSLAATTLWNNCRQLSYP